jgi:hypothetical protein
MSSNKRNQPPKRLFKGERRHERIYDVYIYAGPENELFLNTPGYGPTTDPEKAISTMVDTWFRVFDVNYVTIRDRATGATVARITHTDEPRDARISRPGREDEIRRTRYYTGYPGSGRNMEGKIIDSVEELRAVLAARHRREAEQN